VTADHDELTIAVTDDGIGIGEQERRSGLANLRSRAEQHGGALEVLSPLPPHALPDRQGGTKLRWTIPLT